MKYPVSCLQTILSTLFILCASAAGIGHQCAMADTIRWTGESQSSAQWSNPQNWEGGQLPGFEDVAVIPADKVSPVVDTPATVCGGLVLENSAKIMVQSNVGFPKNGLFIIGDGDLDGDENSDRDEYSVYKSYIDGGSNHDVGHDPDRDYLPNFADPNSDNDHLPDKCEYTYWGFGTPPIDPFVANDENQDSDGDGFSDAIECARRSDPTNETSYAPLSTITGMVVLSLILIAGMVCLSHKRGKFLGGLLGFILLAVLLAAAGYFGTRTVMAESSADIDFALGHTIHEKVETAPPGSTLTINGASDRPWCLGSTYVVPVLPETNPESPITFSLQAVGGAVCIGGMRTSLKIGALGCGTIHCAGAYTAEEGHPMPLPAHEAVCFEELSCFLGERIQFTAHADKGHRFHAWTGSASGTGTTLNYQVTDTGQTVYALFGPPGPDLTATVDTAPSSSLQAGEGFSAKIRVENIGQSGTSESTWDDSFYLSRDAVFDAADLVLATVARSEALASGGDYTASLSVPLPDVAPGRYYLLGVADAACAVADVNRSNNSVAVELIVLDANLAD